MASEHRRRYRVLSRLADGGHGSVHHARLEGAAGFAKDVAIKLLHEHVADERALRRFAHEARLLGLVRDSTVVRVDPPVLLDGRWALVMEFVDGASLATLLERHRALPAGVAVEVIERVARTLDNIWRQRGPDGQPLHLVHRDIKPGNIQITPDGNVRLLDLGIARAASSAVEVSTNTCHGTPGYMPPERLLGVDGPAGDIFSLGIVLHELLLGKRPPVVTDARAYVEGLAVDANTRRLLHLATRMFDLEPANRPSAREVERKAGEIRLLTAPPSLRDWAEAHVTSASGEPDALSGRLLVEDPHTGAVETTAELARPARGGAIVALGAAWLGLAALLVTVGVGALGAAALVAALDRSEPEPAPVVEPAPAPRPVPEAPPPAPVPEPAAVAPPEPEPVAQPTPRARRRPAPSAPQPAPTLTLDDLRVRAEPDAAVVTLVMSDGDRPLHYLLEDASPRHPSQYVVTFRGGASRVAAETWTIDRPVPATILVTERDGALVVAVRSAAPARFAFGGAGPTWTVTLRPR